MKVVFSVILIFLSFGLFSQDLTRVNLILVIDEDIPVGSISNIRLENGEGSRIELTYYPGSLILSRHDFDDVVSSVGDSLFLSFDFYEVTNENQKHYSYQLPFSIFWLEQSFLIFKIYNLNKKAYRKRFNPLNNKPYTLEIIYSGGEILRAKARKTRK